MGKDQTLRVAVIGAGCSGIAAVKNLLEAGVREVTCFEQQADVGGNWNYTADPSHSSVCETTHLISSKRMSEFPDFPMPEDYPDYPSHRQVLAYFRAYARHFDLYPHIRFQTTVKRAAPRPDGRWVLTLDDGSEEVFDYLLVANGHHSVPRHPELPGRFAGRYLHAHDYKKSEPFRDARVLVVGAGNSGCDCAVEISRVARHVAISLRRPHYIIPKFFLGKPTDTFNAGLHWLPKPLVDLATRLSLRLQVGRYGDYGLPDPDFPVREDHPTLNSELLYRIRHGKVHPRKGIQAIEGHAVTFEDGTVESFDTLLAATGYQIAFPFFPEGLVRFEEEQRVPLYLRMFHPEHSRLIFIGLIQPQGAIWPLSDAQARLAAQYILGNWALPENLNELAEKEAEEISKAFLHSRRHTIEVHFQPYLKKLLRQIPRQARGAARPVGQKG